MSTESGETDLGKRLDRLGRRIAGLMEMWTERLELKELQIARLKRQLAAAKAKLAERSKS